MQLPLLLLATFCCTGIAFAAQPPMLTIRPAGERPELRLAREPIAPVAGTRYRLHLESSTDLEHWSAEPDAGTTADGPVWPTPDPPGPYRFFRLRAEVEDTGTTPGGAEVFGYQWIFNEELRRVGFLTPEQFAAAHAPSTEELESVSFDPRNAKYWDAFSADPAVINAGLPPDSPDRRLYDFRLDDLELEVFLKSGFVVSERLGSSTFADSFYRIFSDDLPVFVSADAILHAWHFSYQRLLEEAEETQLAPALTTVLGGMQAGLTTLPDSVRLGPLADNVADADYYLAVALSLLKGQQVSTVFGGDTEVARALTAIAAQQYVPEFPIFGSTRPVDFSQFKIRGHYERSVGLGRYFQTLMWTARTDFRLLADKGDPQSLRELGTAVVLAQLLEASGKSAQWQALDDLIRLFVGRADSMNVAQLEGLLQAAGITSLTGIGDRAQLVDLQQRIFDGTVGAQLYAGDVYVSPFGPEQAQLPRAFAFTGQRFVSDGWAMAQVTFDRILWNEEIPGITFFKKVLRRYPSVLDVAYGVLGNRQTGALIARRMLDRGAAGGFRDGYPYAHNLTAVAATIDRLPPAAWEESIYSRWLAALRALSKPTTDARFPQAMRTTAWAMRTLNTQLASYTELKHDTVLYAKQPYTSIIICEYPAGFVEPVPEFWRQMKEMAEASASGLEHLPASGSISVVPAGDPWQSQPIIVDLAQRQSARVAFCRYFAQQMAILETLATKELQQQPFTDAEALFIRGLMNRQDRPYFGPTYDGWYPGLFYKDYGQLVGNVDSNGARNEDPLVTDIHTAPPDLVDPQGGVLHEATGNVDLLMIAVDNGADRMVYAGPLLSHYEFIVPGPELKRVSDSEWKVATRPPRPDWTRSYLVPRQ